jgi:hypothetical protein
MTRRHILTLPPITLLGLTLVPSNIVAQDGTLKQQLVGTWMLMSADETAVFGSNPKGILFMDAGGRFAAIVERSDRPKLSGNRLQLTTQELAAAAQTFAADYGTWTINEAEKTLTLHREGALNPSNAGTDAKISVSLTGDELKLNRLVLGTTRRDFVYRRVR